MADLRLINESEYSNYLVGKDNVSMQMQLPMVRLFEKRGWTCQPVGLFEGEEIVGVAMLSGKPMKMAGMLYTCQYGPYLDFNNEGLVTDFFSGIIPVLKKLKASKFLCNPYVVRDRYDVTGEVIDHYEYAGLDKLADFGYQLHDLTEDRTGQFDMRYLYLKDVDFATEEELFESYKPKTKRDINSARRNNVEIVEVEEKHMERFCKLMGLSGEKHGFIVHGREYYENLKAEFGDDVLMLVAKIDCEQFLAEKKAELSENLELIESYGGNNRKGRITNLEERNGLLEKQIAMIETSEDIVDGELLTSAGVYVRSANQLIHFLSGNDMQYGKFFSSVAMQHHAMTYAVENGLNIFNMYGVRGDFDKRDSVFQFKVGFGGYVEAYVGTYEVVISASKLKRAELLKKVLKR